ncbi:MAG: phenylalanine--tRNA ligase subunit beta, partial [Solirubrobacterales bacterium]|nr:phenylalanine--tRNA ligase subunit beta [Solirubrobacterales bacterium]
QAQIVATQLMIEVCGARLVPGTVDIGGEGPPPVTIHLRDSRVAGLLGTLIPRQRCAEILQSLQFTTYEEDDGLDVQPPAFRRNDVTREVDLVEEVARIDGLEKLPATLPSRHGVYGRLTPRQRLQRQVVDALRAQGLNEVMGLSFTSPEVAARLRLPEPAAVAVENPLSREQSQLRTELLSSLLDVARHNRFHGAGAIRLFEAGAVYLPQEGEPLPREPRHLAALLMGAVRPPTWREPEPPAADFFAAKGVLAGLLGDLHVSWSVEPNQQPFLHPGKAVAVQVEGQPAGWLGEIHPLVAAQWDLGDTVAAFELDLDVLPEPHLSIYEDVLTHPEVREDLAVVVPESVSAAEVIEVVRRVGAPLLRSAEVFDVYRDPERLGAGNVSLALRLSYRAVDRTLTDEEVAAQRAAISQALADELGGRIRGA